MSSFNRLNNPFVPLIEDHSLFKALYGINPRDVEHAIRGEILIISGKRRRRPIPESEDEEEAEKKFQPGTKCQMILFQERKRKIRIKLNQENRDGNNKEENVTSRKVIKARRKLKPLQGLEKVEDESKLMSDEFKDPVIKISYLTDFESGGINPFAAESMNIIQVGVVTVEADESKENEDDPPNRKSGGGGPRQSTASNTSRLSTLSKHRLKVTEKYWQYFNTAPKSHHKIIGGPSRNYANVKKTEKNTALQTVAKNSEKKSEKGSISKATTANLEPRPLNDLVKAKNKPIADTPEIQSLETKDMEPEQLITDPQPPPLDQLDIKRIKEAFSAEISGETTAVPSTTSNYLQPAPRSLYSFLFKSTAVPSEMSILSAKTSAISLEATLHHTEAKRGRYEPEEEEDLNDNLNYKDSLFSIIKPSSPEPHRNHTFFHDSEISSASDFYKIKKPDALEKGNEWLIKYSTSDESSEQEEKPDRDPAAFEADEAEKMMNCFSSLFMLMKFTGRMPVKYFKKDDTHHTFEFDRTSTSFKLFCVSSAFLTVCCMTMIISLFKIVITEKPYTFYEIVLATEFDKFWVEVMMMTLSMIFTCIWSVGIIFETGLHLGEYLTRWNLCIVLLKYEVTRNLRLLIYLGYAIYGAYAFTLIYMFFAGGDDIPTVRGASGFMALMIFQPYSQDLRIQPSYYIFEYLGLIIHLYSTLCSGMILLMILAYAKALKNAAQRFNLRLAYVLRKVILPSENRKYLNIRRYIPYRKLYAEHIVVTSFSRHMGTVFGVPFVAFYAMKVIEMVVTLYSFFSPIVNSFPHFNDTFVNISSVASASDCTPIPYAEPREVIIGKSIYLVCESWLLYFVFSEIVRDTGETIMNGFAIIRRHGLLLSKSTEERRFISSLQHSFSRKTTFYINPLFKINREFILAFVGFVIAMFIFLTQFSPQRLTTQVSVVCNQAGLCRTRTYKKFWKLSKPLQKIENDIEKDLENGPSSSTTEPSLLSTTPYFFPPTQTGTPRLGRYASVPCKSFGTIPIEKSDLFYPCNLTGSPLIYRPTIFKKVPRHSQRSVVGEVKRYYYFDRILPSCNSAVNIKNPVYDCFGQQLSDSTHPQDECNTLKLITPDQNGQPVKDTSIKLVTFNPNVKEKEYLYCCWSYSQLKAQEGTCNLETGRDPQKICQKKVGSAPGTESRRELYENLFWREVRVQNGKLNDLKVSWTDCICQYTTGVLKLKDDCKALVSDYPPCSPEFEKWQPSQGLWKTSMCSWNEYRSLDKGIKQQILYKRDEFLQYFPISKASVAGCEKITYLNKDFDFKLDPEDTLVDCFGKTQDESIVETMDDCQHLNLVGGTQTMHLEYFDTTNLPPGLINRSIFCCYTIGCNLQASSISKRCGKSPKGTERSGMEALFWTYLKEHGNRLDTKELDEWTICICQGVGTTPLWNDDLCKSFRPTTTTSTTITTASTTTPTAISDPKNIPPCDPRFVTGAAPHYWSSKCAFSFFKTATKTVFKMSLLYKQKFVLGLDEYQYSPIVKEKPQPCENVKYPMTLSELNADFNYLPGADTKITDCWGEEVNDETLNTRDDCQNLKLGNDVEGSDLRLVYFNSIQKELLCCYSSDLNEPCNFLNVDEFKNNFRQGRCDWKYRKEVSKIDYMEKALRLLEEIPSKEDEIMKRFEQCICQDLAKPWDEAVCDQKLLYGNEEV